MSILRVLYLEVDCASGFAGVHYGYVRDGLGLGLGLGKQRRVSWTGQELENENIDDDVALIARELEKGLREISTRRERKCLRLVTHRPYCWKSSYLS